MPHEFSLPSQISRRAFQPIRCDLFIIFWNTYFFSCILSKFLIYSKKYLLFHFTSGVGTLTFTLQLYVFISGNTYTWCIAKYKNKACVSEWYHERVSFMMMFNGYRNWAESKEKTLLSPWIIIILSCVSMRRFFKTASRDFSLLSE